VFDTVGQVPAAQQVSGSARRCASVGWRRPYDPRPPGLLGRAWWKRVREGRIQAQTGVSIVTCTRAACVREQRRI